MALHLSPLRVTFQSQPSTKGFEYLSAGMPVLATDTVENRKVIGPENGVLFQDTADRFHTVLKTFYGQRGTYDSGRIWANSVYHSWEHIINADLECYLEVVMCAEPTHRARDRGSLSDDFSVSRTRL